MRKITNPELNRLSKDEFQKAPKIPVVVVLEDVRSAMNVGAVFRTADAFAIQKLVLCGITATPPSKEIHKTALGAELSVEWSYAANVSEVIDILKNEGYTVVAVEQVQNAVELQKLDVKQYSKYALIFGNEVDGVKQSTVDLCDCAIEIPQAGTKHSLNVSAAAAVVMWTFFQQSINLITER